jgi:ketosteroid isomerase-like protein
MNDQIKDIRDFFHVYKRAAWERDYHSMVNLYDENVIIYDLWNLGYSLGLHEWSASIKEWFGSLKEEHVNVEFDMISIQESEMVSFASALVIFQAGSRDGTILREMKNRMTVGLVRTDNGWKVTHQHTSLPISSSEFAPIFL